MTGSGVASFLPHGGDQVCACCRVPICSCPDPLYAGVVTIDRASEPGAWARHIRDTACMPGHGPASTETRP